MLTRRLEILLPSLLVLLPGLARAQVTDELRSRARDILALRARPQFPPERTLDVLHYRLHLTVDVGNKTVSGQTELVARPWGVSRPELVLDADGLEITRVREVGGADLAFEHSGTRLAIDLGRVVPADQAVTLLIDHHARPRRGLVFQVTGSDAALERTPEVFSQGQCSMNSAWFPCRDYPDDRATLETWFDVPAELQTVGNGELLDSIQRPGGRRTDHWKLDQEIPVYLATLVLGQLERVSLGRVGAIPLVAHAHPDHIETVKAGLRCTGEILQYLSDLTGVPYPYPIYQQVCVDGFPYGGMENASASTLDVHEISAPDGTLAGRFETENLVVHELAHQWWGNLVTCADWADIWLHEGFATYAEILYREHRDGPEAALLSLAEQQRTFRKARIDGGRPIVWRTFAVADELYEETAYQGGACVLHLLRTVVGDEKFFRGLRAWTGQFAGKSVTTEDFETTFQQATGEDLGAFFEDWLHSPGLPTLLASWRFDAEEQQLELSVQQIQDEPDIYELPLAVAFQGEFGRQRVILNLDARRTILRVPCPSRPHFVRFNDGGAVPAMLLVEQSQAAWRKQLRRGRDPLGRLLASGMLESDSDDPAQGAVSDLQPAWNLFALSRALTEDPLAEVRAAAATSLGEWTLEPARTALYTALWDVDRNVRSTVAQALGEREDDRTSREMILRRVPYEADDRVRQALLQATIDPQQPSAARLLFELVKSDDLGDDLRGTALVGLAELAPGNALAPAREFVRQGYPTPLRLLAVRALGVMAEENEEAREALLAHLTDPWIAVRFAVIQALRRLPAGIGLAELIESFDELGFPDLQAQARKLIKRGIRSLER